MIFEINEMFEYISESYQEYINLGRGERYAVARIFDEYDMFDDDLESVVDDMITMLAIGELIINNECLYVKTVERLKKAYGNKQLFIDALRNQITESELNDLLERIKRIESGLADITITDDPNY